MNTKTNQNHGSCGHWTLIEDTSLGTADNKTHAVEKEKNKLYLSPELLAVMRNLVFGGPIFSDDGKPIKF